MVALTVRFAAGAICLVIVCLLASCHSQPEPPPPLKRIVFVCVENSNRSQMAEAFARIHGAGKVEPFSAGSRPSGQVNPKAVEAMRELGYDLAQHRSKSLSALTGIEFDVAVTMGCGDECPFI